VGIGREAEVKRGGKQKNKQNMKGGWYDKREN
jgi:hypothetical protein